MNREKLLEQAPTAEDLRSVPDSHRKDLSEKYVAAVLNALEADRREPDAWEAMYLNLAIGDIIMRKYALSINKTLRSLTPPRERAESLRQPPQKRSLKDLWHYLNYVEGMAAHKD